MPWVELRDEKFNKEQPVRDNHVGGDHVGLFHSVFVSNNSCVSLHAILPNGTICKLNPMYVSNIARPTDNVTIVMEEMDESKPLNSDKGTLYSFDNVRRYRHQIYLSKILECPVFLPDIGYIICTEHQINVVKHPYAEFNYEIVLSEILKKIDTHGLTMQFMANDPTKKYDKLYIGFMGVMTSIPVTHIQSKESIFMSSVVQNNRIIAQKKLDISVLKDTGAVSDDTHNVAIYVSRSEWELKNIMALKPSEKSMDSDYIKALEDKYQKELESQKNLFDAEKNKMTISIKELTNVVDAQKMKLAELDSAISMYRGMVGYNVDMTKADSVMTAARMKTAQEGIKLMDVVIKVGVPVLVALVTWYVARTTVGPKT